jgi:hypothetical protein
MKNVSLLAILVFLNLSLLAQRIMDSAVYGPSYANQVHYQLDDEANLWM